MNPNASALQQALTEAFAAKWATEQHPQYADLVDKFVFHMTDAAAEIRVMAALLQSPEALNPADFGKALHRFFLHAVPHLVSAGQLYDFVPEIFPEQRGVHVLPGPEGASGTETELL